jgi:hypothetical protein
MYQAAETGSVVLLLYSAPAYAGGAVTRRQADDCGASAACTSVPCNAVRSGVYSESSLLEHGQPADLLAGLYWLGSARAMLAWSSLVAVRSSGPFSRIESDSNWVTQNFNPTLRCFSIRCWFKHFRRSGMLGFRYTWIRHCALGTVSGAAAFKS